MPRLTSSVLARTLSFALLTSAAQAQLSITDPGQDVFNFSAPTGELSGLSWLTADSYQAVSDAVNERRSVTLRISLNPADGRITAASQTASSTLATGYDLEGIAWCPPRNSFFVSDEGQWPVGGHLREFLPDSSLLRSLSLPSVILNDRQNFSLESCSWAAGALWTANEEALAQESSLSSASSGSVVRLLKLDHRLQPAGQWAYLTDSFGSDSPFTTLERSGIADLCALPDGNLLVLERTLGLGSIPSFRNRIYLVSFTDATDVSSIPDLDEAAHRRVSKTLLWERNMTSVQTRNFEAITLGPPLPAIAPDARSLLLLADNGGDASGTQHLYALVLRGLVSPPPMTTWRQAFWGTPEPLADAAPDADPDRDSISNLSEYALGGDPLSPSSSPLPRFSTGTGLALSFNRFPDRSDITLTVQAADSPGGPWLPIARSSSGEPFSPLDAAVSITESGPDFSRNVTVRDSTTSATRRFLRLAISTP